MGEPTRSSWPSMGGGSVGHKYDMLRIDVVQNGFVIMARKAGKTPASYAYDDRAIAMTIDEVAEIVKRMLK